MPSVKGTAPGFYDKDEIVKPHQIPSPYVNQNLKANQEKQETSTSLEMSDKVLVAGSKNYYALEPRYNDDGKMIFGGKSRPQENNALTEFLGKDKLTVHFLNKGSYVNFFDPSTQTINDYANFISKSITYKEGMAHEAFRDSRMMLEETAREDWNTENQNEIGVSMITPKDCIVCNEDGSMRGVFRCDMSASSTSYYLIANPETCEFPNHQPLEDSANNSPEE